MPGLFASTGVQLSACKTRRLWVPRRLVVHSALHCGAEAATADAAEHLESLSLPSAIAILKKAKFSGIQCGHVQRVDLLENS